MKICTNTSCNNRRDKRPKRLALAAGLLSVLLCGCAAPVMQQTPELTTAPEPVAVLEAALPQAKTHEAAAGPVAAALAKVTPTPVPTPEPTPAPTPTPTPELTPEPTPVYEGFVEIGGGGDRGYVKAHDVNLRSGPGTEYDKIGELDHMTELRITGKTEQWYRVKTEGAEGFVLKELIGVGRVPEATPTPKPTATPKPAKTPKPTATPKPAEIPTEPEPDNAEAVIPVGAQGNYSEQEIYVAAKCLYSEGKSQSEESFLAMANVLLNRVESSRWPDTISENVYKKGQYSMPSKNPDGFAALIPSEAAISAAERVFNGGERVLPSGVEFFKSARLGTTWGSHTFYQTIGGNNYFYR